MVHYKAKQFKTTLNFDYEQIQMKSPFEPKDLRESL